VAVLPFYVERLMTSGGGDLAVLRILRLGRVLRMLKVRV
jgi:hypothetical protein